jgi:hypothetical protein
MSTASPLPRRGIASGLTDADDLLPEKIRWNQLARMRAVVGTCGYLGCPGELLAIEPSQHDAQGEDEEITWYEARCEKCGKEYAAPNGRVLRRSSAHAETPSQWLAERERRDGELRKVTRKVH